MAKFKAPYGTKDQHVISPAQHLGYRFLVAYLVDCGMNHGRIVIACADAASEGAPKDAVCRRKYGGWIRRIDISDHQMARRLDGYAAALTQYETEIRREWNLHR